MEGLGAKEDKSKKGGLEEGTDDVNLAVNHHPHGNLTSASSDENLKDIFHHIKTSKTPVSIQFNSADFTNHFGLLV